MERIQELQKQLANIQKTDNISKISDRVVVDIMNKLIETFDMKLIYSRDGTEYITEDALCKAIQDLVIEKGRLTTLHLPDMLNIHAEKIEQQLSRVCNHPFHKLYNISGDLLTSSYLDTLCLSLHEHLSIHLKCTFSDLAIKYHLPKAFLQQAIEERMNTLLDSVSIRGEEIVTQGFMETQKAKVRGMLRGAIQPVYLKDSEKDIPNILEITTTLISCHELDGTLKDSTTYIPTRFHRNQESITRGFFHSNNYLDLQMLEKQLSINRPKEFVKALFKDNAVFVEGGIVFNKEALDSLKQQIPQLMEIEGWTDLTVMFPSAFSENQVEILVKNYVLNEYQQKYVLHSGYIFSEKYLQKCSSKFKDKIIHYIYNAPQKLITDDKDQQKGKKKGSKKKNQQQQSKNQMFDSEEIISCLIEANILEQDDRDFDFEEHLCEVLQPKILEVYQQIKEELFENKKSTTTEIIQQIQKKIEDKMVTLQFIVRSLKFVEQNHTKVDTTIFHKTSQTEAKLVFDNLLMLICKKHLIQLPQNLFLLEQIPSNYNEETDLKQIFKDSNTRDLVIEKIPKDLQKPFKELHELAYKDPVLYKFVDSIQANSEVLSIKIMQDKKVEKNFFYYQKHMSREKCKQLKEIIDPIGLGFYVFVSLLAEQSIGLFFCDKYERKALMQIILIVQEVMAYDQNAIEVIKELIALMTNKETSNKEYEKIQMNVVNDLLKLVKL